MATDENYISRSVLLRTSQYRALRDIMTMRQIRDEEKKNENFSAVIREAVDLLIKKNRSEIDKYQQIERVLTEGESSC